MRRSPVIVEELSKAGDFMRPANISVQEAQGELFFTRLDQILNRQHPLFELANQIDWFFFDQEFGPLFVENVGRPGLSTRLVIGLHYLKHAFNESDESVVGHFLENPYWQYFCGFEYFQHELPLDPSSLVRWRKRLGPERLEKLLVQTLETAKRGKLLTERHVERVNVDTTVQEKSVAFPTDARLTTRPGARWCGQPKSGTSSCARTTSAWGKWLSSSRAATPMPASLKEQDSKPGNCASSWAGSSETSNANACFPMRCFPAC